MSKISISNLSFAFGGNTIFDNVSFTLDSSWKLGLIGRNGRGKTTLLKLICGHYEYTGTISSPLTFEYFPYNIVKDAYEPAIDVLSSLNPNVEQWQIIREAKLLELNEDAIYMPYQLLSPGQQTKLQLALMFSQENSFLLIDEPTNHLDADGRKCVAKYLNSKEGFIVVSHDRNFLNGCIDHVLAIEKNKISLHKGNYSSWEREFERTQQRELSENKRLKTEIENLSKAAEEKQRWANRVEKTKIGSKVAGLRPDRGHIGHMAAKMAKKSQVAISHMERDIEKKKKLLKNYETSPALSISPQNSHFKHLVTINDLCVSYDTNLIIKNLNLEIDAGERIAIAGPNGCGKSTLFKAIIGDIAPSSGTITKPQSLEISYLPQDIYFTTEKLEDYIKTVNADETLFKTILRKLGFSRDTFSIPLHKYSLGQRKKVAIAASLCSRAHLYLWDEPLNYLDVASRIQLEHLIIECKPSMLIIEHDDTFVKNVTTRELLL